MHDSTDGGVNLFSKPELKLSQHFTFIWNIDIMCDEPSHTRDVRSVCHLLR